MTHCIKTGAVIWLENYQACVRGDVHTIEIDKPDSLEVVYIVKFNPHSWDHSASRVQCDWALEYFTSDFDVFWQKEQGIIVAPQRFFHCINLLRAGE